LPSAPSLGDGPVDPSGEIGFVTDHILYAQKHEIALRNNPYNMFDAYLFASLPPETLADQKNTWTDYVPKDDKTYYISCLGMPVAESECNILFVYSQKIDVDVGIISDNIPNAVLIIRVVTTFLDRSSDGQRA